MKTRKIIGGIITAIAGGLIAVFVYSQYFQKSDKIIVSQMPAHFTKMEGSGGPVDLTFAAEQTVHGVVHVTTKSKAERQNVSPFEFFFGPGVQSNPQPVVGIGSGVIISPGGYIVTNNHVIKNANEIHVKLNDNREFDAKLIGSDASTDLAVIKINAEDLPFIAYGNSEELKQGEWVLAVGNPFNLASTVTAGIISATGRNLNMVDDQYRIESFIQTDAALNPGNSGGALVNTKGELIGINTAIISMTGGYAGNSFAIPVTIVKKVVSDIIEFGVVQRAMLGIVIEDVDAEIAKERKLPRITGVNIKELKDESSAKAAGLKVGDVIIKINDAKVDNSAMLQEQISKYRPNDKIKVVVIRDKDEKTFDVILKNMNGTTGIVKASENKIMGVTLAEASNEEKQKLGIKNGVKITNIEAGKFLKAGIEEEFIIIRINNKPVNSVEDVRNSLNNTKGGVYIEGIYPNGVVAYYAFGN